MIAQILRSVTNSLSARLLGIFFLTALVYGFAARFAVELVLDRDYLREIVGSHIALHTTYFLEDIGLPPDIERAAEIAETNPMDIRIIGPDVDWASDPSFPDLEQVEFEPSRFFDAVEQDVFRTPDGRDVFATLGFAELGEHSFVRVYLGDYRILLSSPKISTDPPASGLTAQILIGLISIVVLFGCFFAVSWLIRPIRWIQEGADRMGQGDLDYRIPTTRSDDLGALAKEVNELAGDVQSMLEAKQQMLLAISHELRSPLTRSKVAVEFLEDQETRQNILDDLEEMEHLISDLLESERLNTRHTTLQRSSVDPAQLVTQLIDNDFHGARDRIELALPAETAAMSLDETRIRLLIKNLVDNALRYSTEDNGPVRIRLEQSASALRMSVADQGQGMSAEEVERATEPFYRADPARSRDTGGFGLGLYLCRRIAEAHEGTLQIDSQEGQGTRITLEIPVDPGE